MAKYKAIVRFDVLDFEADSIEQANFKVDTLINELSAVDTNVNWDYVQWDLIEEDKF